MYLPLDFSEAKNYEGATEPEKRRLFSWESDMLDKLADNIFANHLIFCPDKRGRRLFALCWGHQPSEWEPRVRLFSEKAAAASATITQTKPYVLATGFFQSSDELPECRRQLMMMQEHYYLGTPGVFFHEMPLVQFQPLGLSGLGGRLTAELRSKNSAGVCKLLERATDKLRETPHERGQAEWLCGEICTVLNNVLPAEDRPALCRYWESEQLLRRDQMIRWLEMLRTELAVRLEQYASSKQELIEKAQQYVRDNVDKRIMLQDVADHVCISPGYLSALFKKMYNQNFVDYINHVKMERARELIREGKYRIYEISDMLSFENAYYFSQVFKRHIGTTPTGYQKQIRRDGNVE